MNVKMCFGIVIKESITNELLLCKLKQSAISIYPHRLNGLINTTILKLEIPTIEVDAIGAEISKNILPNGFYAHFVINNDIMVIYPNRIFKFSMDQLTTINDCISYGESIGIKKELMQFDKMLYRDHPNNKNAIVFGGSGDLGSAFCDLLLEIGYNVYSTYFNNKEKQRNNSIYFNISDKNIEFYKNINKINIDCMIFCIGIKSSKQYVVNTKHEEYERLINVNALGFLDIYKNLSNNFRKNKSKVLVVSSSAALEHKKTNGAYSSSKACLDSIVKTLQKEESQYGVQIKLIHPSLFNSRLANEIIKIKGYNNIETYIDEVLDGHIKSAKDVAYENKFFFTEEEE